MMVGIAVSWSFLVGDVVILSLAALSLFVLLCGLSGKAPKWLFGVEMDPRTLASDLAKQGSADYTRWTDADRRIVRRKQLATEFDTRLTAYFERKRSAVLEEVRFKE